MSFPELELEEEDLLEPRVDFDAPDFDVVEEVPEALVLRPFVVDPVAESDDLLRERVVDAAVLPSVLLAFLPREEVPVPEVLPVELLRLLPLVDPLPVDEEPPLIDPELPEPIEPVLPDADEDELPRPELPEPELPELPEPDIDPDD